MPPIRRGNHACCHEDQEVRWIPCTRHLPGTKVHDWDDRFPCPLRRNKRMVDKGLVPALRIRRHFTEFYPLAETEEYFCPLEPCDPFRPHSRKDALTAHMMAKRYTTSACHLSDKTKIATPSESEGMKPESPAAIMSVSLAACEASTDSREDKECLAPKSSFGTLGGPECSSTEITSLPGTSTNSGE